MTRKANFLIPSWRPKASHMDVVPPKPEWVPDWVYTNALSARHQYNTNWEMWVYMVSVQNNKPLAETEDACIRGIKKMFLQNRYVYGDKIGQWFEDFMDMDSIFSRVRGWPQWEARLDFEEKK